MFFRSRFYDIEADELSDVKKQIEELGFRIQDIKKQNAEEGFFFDMLAVFEK
jgi:hypothetical protein